MDATRVRTPVKILYVSERRHNRLDAVRDQVGRPFYLAKYLSEHAEVHWVTLHDGPPRFPQVERTDLGFGPVRLYNVPVGRAPWMLGYARLAGAVLTVAKREAPDLAILTSEMGEVAFGLFGTRVAGVPTVVDFMDDCASFPYYFNRRTVQDWVIRNARLFACASVRLRDLITERNPRSEVLFLPNGFEASAFPHEGREEIRRSLGIPPAAKVVLYAGTVRGAGSGVRALPEAVRLAQAAGPGEIILAIIGPNLTSAAEDWKELPPGTRRLGTLPRAEVFRWMRAADLGTILNAPSDFSEYAFPLKIFDYLGSGLPIVSTPIPSARWAAERFDRVFLSPGYGAKEIGATLLEALRRPPNREQASLAAYEWAVLVSGLLDWVGSPRAQGPGRRPRARAPKRGAWHRGARPRGNPAPTRVNPRPPSAGP